MPLRDLKWESVFLVPTTRRIILISSETSTRLATIVLKDAVFMPRNVLSRACVFLVPTTGSSILTSSRVRTRLVMTVWRSRGTSTKRERELLFLGRERTRS